MHEIAAPKVRTTRRTRGAPGGARVPLLEPSAHGLSSRFAAMLGREAHPALVFAAAMLIGLLIVSGCSVAAGFLITHVLVHSSGIGGANRHVDAWLASHRTGTRTEASLIASIAAGWIVLPILVAVVGAALAIARKWLLAAYTISAPIVEVVAYRVTTLTVHEHRPTVLRLEKLPLEASYPSGHTAASIAVYGGLALLILSRIRNPPARLCIWLLAVAIPLYVGLSRMYRGMHYPLDVAGGALLGIGTLTVIIFGCRSAAAAAGARARTRVNQLHEPVLSATGER